ncbi:MAG TPA: hypothetical protein VEL79_07165, partial [Vicinamibacterales bacterium]|nr:hypothetical protein [Vicinamibacterales bacterium]
ATGNVDNSSQAQVNTRQFETPNLVFVNNTGPETFTPKHEFKLLGSYQIPVIDTSVSAYLFSTSGLPYGRIQQFSSSALNTSGVSSAYRRLFIAPRGAYFLPTLHSLDLRIEKNIRMGSGNKIGIYGEIQNVANSGIITSKVQRSTSVTLTNGSTFPLPFGTPAGLQAPRQIRLGARWSF